jgi:predicted PurR-regulated permease PerM
MNAAQNAIGAIAAVVTVLLLPLYLLVEAESLQRTFLRVFPADRRPAIARMTGDVTLKVGAWLGGQLLLAVIIGTTATIGLWIIGVPFFYVFGLIAALGEFIPVVGPIIAAVPAVLMGWTDSPTTALVVVAFFSGQQFVENNILVPRVMESQVGVSAVTVLIALLIGSALLGILGAVLAVPTAAIAQVLFQELVGSEPPRNRKGGAK